jgi:hypothetical protein
MPLNASPIVYNGEDTNLLVAETLRGTNLVQKSGHRVLQGYKSTAHWGTLEGDACLGAYELCATTIQDQRYEEYSTPLTRFQANFRIRHDSLRATLREKYYRAGQLNGSFLDDAEVQRLLLDIITKKLGTAADQILMRGGSYYAFGDGCIDLNLLQGIMAQLRNDNNVPEVVATDSTTVATSPTTGVFTAFDRALAALPEFLRFSSDPERKLKIYASPTVAQAFHRSISQIGGGSYYVAITQGGSPQFVANQTYPTGLIGDGMIEVVTLSEIPAGKFYITWPGNIGIFYDDANDFANVLMVDGRNSVGICDYVEMRVNALMGVDVFRPEEAVVAI